MEVICVMFFFFFKQKTAYEMRISDSSSDVCSSDLSYIGRFQSWRVFCAFNPAEHHHLVDRKLEFNEVATKAGLPVSKTLAVVTQDQSAGPFLTIRSEGALRSWMEANEIADVVLKPVAGTKGWGVLSLGSRAPQGLAWRTLPGGEGIDLAAIDRT